MQVQIERVSPVVLEVAVEVPADAVKAQAERVHCRPPAQGASAASGPGRPRAKCSGISTGPNRSSDVANAIVNDTLPSALSEKNVTPVNQPQVETGQVR